MSKFFAALKPSGRHAWAIAGIVATVVGMPCVYALLDKLDLNTNESKTCLLAIGFAVSVVSFFLGWQERNVTSQLEFEKQRRDAAKESDSLVAKLTDEIEGKQAALDSEKRKNAELASRWEKLNSEENRKRESFDMLSEREKWCLSHVWDTHPRKFSISGDLFVSDFRTLVDVGALRFDGTEEHGGEIRSVYAISFEWRRWIEEHADELPEPTNKAPS